jgi:hypothetical protein
MEKEPFAIAEVAMFVLLTATVAPSRGDPSLLVITPDIFRCAKTIMPDRRKLQIRSMAGPGNKELRRIFNTENSPFPDSHCGRQLHIKKF